MNTRADRIANILSHSQDNRKRTSDIRDELRTLEQLPDLVTSIVSSTVIVDNKTRDAQGLPKRFKTFGEGDEEHGWISLNIPKPLSSNITEIVTNPVEEIPELIKSANEKTREQLKDEIRKLSWLQFESNFLETLLEALGFQGVEITQPTRDEGKDALCVYRRGLVQSQAIVSAKHWSSKDVAADEVQRLRGIKGPSDTGVIVTSSYFSEKAKEEAMPSQNQRSIVLIDIDLIIDTCISHKIGVREADIPKLFSFQGFSDIFGNLPPKDIE